MNCLEIISTILVITVVLPVTLIPVILAQPRPPISLTFYLQEEMQPGSLVGNIIKEARLDETYAGDELESLRFSFLSEPTLRFELEHRSGILITKERIDREQICPMMEHCQESFDIAISPVSLFQIVKVTVIIEDINDNAPVFSETHVLHQILESAPRLTAIPIPSAVDADSPTFGIQNYTWFDPSNKFFLETVRKIDGSTDLKLVLRKRLDREWTNEYKVTITAFDGTGLSGSTNITIEVLDANDNNPVFLNSSYEVTIEENIEINDIILRVQATDLDIGENGDILYGFSSRTRNKYGHLFEMDIYTGDIRVIGDIDYEEHKVFHLGVSAQDQGRGSLSADTTVVVNVKDINDNAPKIMINTLLDPSADQENGVSNRHQHHDESITRAEVLEDSEIGTFVAHVTVSDGDNDDNGKFDCFLNNDHFKLNILYDTEYAIVTEVALDRETKSHYSLIIECADYGTPMQTSMSKLQVTVADKNDHEPEFRKSEYSVSIDENNYASFLILTVHATDADIGKNAQLNYVLDPEVLNLFDLDETQGILSAKTSLNREDYTANMGRIEFNVYAYDQGDPQRYGKARVVITLRDLNDESPIFTKNQYSFGIFEDEPIGTSVGQVNAMDLDASPYNQHEYKFSENGNKRITDLFSLDENTGEIHTLVTFDTEMQAIYRFIVIAFDLDDPYRIGSANVSVYIADKNDNTPKFIFPTPANHTVQVSALLSKNQKVARVIAIDRDQGDNAKVRYSIAPGGHNDLFSINKDTGIIRTMRSLTTASRSVYELDIQARDAIHVESATLIIYVNESLPLPPKTGTVMRTTETSPSDYLSGLNLFIVILLAIVSAIIAVILIIAIIIIHRRSRHQKDSEGHYNCRQEEAKKILATHTQPEAIGRNNGHCVQPVAHNPSLVVTNSKQYYIPSGGGTLSRDGTLQRKTSGSPKPTHLPNMHSSDAQHSALTDKKKTEGKSEDKYDLPSRYSKGERNMRPLDTNSLNRRSAGLNPSNNSYHKVKPDFRTFNPVSTLPRELNGIQNGSSHSLHNPNCPINNDIIIRSLSPKPNYSQTIHPQSMGKTKPHDREKHNVNSYTPGFKVDLDVCSYPVNDFIHNSNAREDAV